MKLGIISYQKNSGRRFEQEKRKISGATSIKDIHHISSTSVSGLGGKGIIDIMIGVENWKETENLVKKLKAIGFKHVHPKIQGKIFLSKHRKPTPDNVHLHIIRSQSKQYRELLAFRDYLRKHKKEIQRFFKLKKEWSEKAKGDRFEYNQLKSKYVKEIIRKAF